MFYLPEGSSQKSYYTGRSGYGGTDKIKGTTLLRAPLFVRGSTGGKVPEAAYDFLMGKGASKLMIADVRQCVYGGNYWNRKSEEMVKGAEDALRKYDGDASLGWMAIHYSKNINASLTVSENIIANAVRRGGYDSVVGWNRRRDGTKFITEVFDLRERTYPIANHPGQIHFFWLDRMPVDPETPVPETAGQTEFAAV